MAGASTPRPFTLLLLRGAYSISRLPPTDPVPAWADGGGFSSITRTDDELSIICESGRVPAGMRSDGGWRLFRVQGPFAFDTVGVLAALTSPLAGAGISLLAVATYDTDHLLVKEEALASAMRALTQAGHRIVSA